MSENTTPEKEPIFTPREWRLGCGILFLVWLVGTIVLTIANWSLLPVAAEALGMSGGWVNVALVSNAIVLLFKSGLTVGVGMILIGGFIFALLMTWSFFSGRLKTAAD